jgi:hypothetical protein
MSVPREVIVDLLPLYMAGEVSPATRVFVERALAQDPELARKVRDEWDRDLAGGPGAAPPPELELTALRKTRRMLGLQKWLFGLAIAFTATTFSLRVDFTEGRIVSRFLLSEHPVPFGISLLLGIVFWVCYYILRRRLRTTAP